MKPDEPLIRSVVFDEHQALRLRLDALEALLGRAEHGDGAAFVKSREELQALLDALLRHLDDEETLLRPLLKYLDAWGPVRLELLERDHQLQRARVAELSNLGTEVTASHWTGQMRQFAARLRDDMASEEHDFLPPNRIAP